MSNTPNTANVVDLARLRSAANDLQGLAAGYGVPMPAEHGHAARVAAAAKRLTHDAGTAPLALPKSADKTADTIRKAATDRMLARESITVAAELAEMAEREVLRHAYATMPAIFRALERTFDAARERFAALVETAPLEVTADTSPEQAAEHVELLRLVGQFTSAAAARLRLAEIAGEEVKGATMTWLLLDPKPEANVSEIRAALTGELPGDLAGWLRMVHLGCSLAHADQAEQRAQRFGQALYHAGLATRDGGRAERTYGQALALVPGASS